MIKIIDLSTSKGNFCAHCLEGSKKVLLVFVPGLMESKTGLFYIWSEMAQLFSFVVRSNGGLDRGSLGFFTGRVLVEFYSSVDFVYRFAVIPILTLTNKRTTLNEHMHGSREPVVLSPGVIDRFFRQSHCRSMGNLRRNALVDVGFTRTVGMELGGVGCNCPWQFTSLDGGLLLGAMVSPSSTFVGGADEYCRYVCICRTSCLVVAIFLCAVHRATAAMADT